jgi:hypothetical protein
MRWKIIVQIFHPTTSQSHQRLQWGIKMALIHKSQSWLSVPRVVLLTSTKPLSRSCNPEDLPRTITKEWLNLSMKLPVTEPVFKWMLNIICKYLTTRRGNLSKGNSKFSSTSH